MNRRYYFSLTRPLVVLSLLTLATAFIVSRSIVGGGPKVLADNPCNKFGGNQAGPVKIGGYEYKVIKVGINSNPSIPGELISSQTCTGNYGGSETSTDLIDPNQGIFSWTDGSFGVIRPDNLELGFSTSFPNPVGPYNCVTGAPTSLFAIPSVAGLCNNFTASQNIDRSATGVDDGGRMIIGGKDHDHTIWCQRIDTANSPPGSTPPFYTDCGPDIYYGYPKVNGIEGQSGHGFMFRTDQCIAAGIPQSTFSCSGSNGWARWYLGPGLIGTTNLTNILSLDAANYIKTLYIHFQARDSGSGVVGANSYLTVRYPLNAASCTIATNPVAPSVGQPVTATVTFNNTGTRPWWNQTGHSARRTNKTANFPIGSIINNGQQFTFTDTLNMPAGGLSYDLVQNGGVIKTCNTAINSDSFTLNPSQTAKLDDNENPTKINLHSEVDVSTGSTATHINGITVSRTYFVENSAGANIGTISNLTFTTPAANKCTPPIPICTDNINAEDATAPVPNPPTTTTIKFGDKYCVELKVNITKGQVDSTGNLISSDPTSGYDQTNCDTIVNKPYLRIYGTDVFAGRQGCTPSSPWQDTQANIQAFTRSTSGSGAQLGVFALGAITGGIDGHDTSNAFNSAQLRNSSPQPPPGLSFANDQGNGVIAPPYGNFSAAHCPVDFWAAYTQNGVLAPSPNPAGNDIKLTNNYDTHNNSVFYYKGGGLFTLAQNPGEGVVTYNASDPSEGSKIIIVVDGSNVLINHDITYSGENNKWSVGSDLSHSLQSFTLIVRGGNIFVDHNVSTLNGTFIAQPNGGGGTIYTCTNGSSPYDNTDSNIAGDCNKQLRVNGAFVANNVKWLRTFGSLRDSSATEEPNHPAKSCSNGGPGGSNGQSIIGDVCAAEVINYSPAAYMTIPALPTTSFSTPDLFLNTLQPIL